MILDQEKLLHDSASSCIPIFVRAAIPFCGSDGQRQRTLENATPKWLHVLMPERNLECARCDRTTNAPRWLLAVSRPSQSQNPIPVAQVEGR
jgi:hypothetical protein